MCPEIDTGVVVLEKLLASINLEISDATECDKARLKQLSRVCAMYWNQKKYSSLFELMLATNLSGINLNHNCVINVLVSTTAEILYNIERDWTCNSD